MRGDRLRVEIGMAGIDAARQRLDQIVRPEVQEERHRVARMVAPRRSRIGDAVGGRAQPVVGQPLEHVADIDGELALLGRH